MKLASLTRGHPLHAALSDFPVAFICCAPICDLIGWWRDSEAWWTGGFAMAIAAIGFALPAAATGLWELAKIPATYPSARLGVWHASFMGSAIAVECIAVSVHKDLTMVSLALKITAALLVITGGWFGGHMVFVHGVGAMRSAAKARDE